MVWFMISRRKPLSYLSSFQLKLKEGLDSSLVLLLCHVHLLREASGIDSSQIPRGVGDRTVRVLKDELVS